ncbi:hypothetical protein LWI28_028340 [Acer negundo]|uniref:Uncharacterized protein n=1 Tax=Acer negundo TaxID=4023 RepID=A0AAD5JY99_ACENE|nr:hypothetical protein LWI28_028340 [Acer negundo]KAK4860626.1 hypothetical protein QYF36_027475 [Acer negundo]
MAKLTSNPPSYALLFLFLVVMLLVPPVNFSFFLFASFYFLVDNYFIITPSEVIVMCTVECRDAKGGSKTLPEEKQNTVRILWKHRQLQPSVQEQGKCREWSLPCTTSGICMFLLL